MIIMFHASFKKRYVKIPLSVRRKFDERFVLFEKDSFHPILRNHPLSGDRTGQWSINITGDWRAIYVFRDKDSIIFVDIDTHSKLYR